MVVLPILALNVPLKCKIFSHNPGKIIVCFNCEHKVRWTTYLYKPLNRAEQGFELAPEAKPRFLCPDIKRILPT